MIHKSRLLIFIAVGTLLATAAWSSAQTSDTVQTETQAQRDMRMAWWREARFGMFIHWGPASLTGKEISWSRKATGIEVYDNLYKQFNPVKFDARAWVSAATNAGMRYIVLIAKHHDGFILWDSKTIDYTIMHTPFGRDVVGELAKASREAGVPFCVYFSPGDWKDPDCRHPENNPRFVERMHAQLAELLGNYGRIPLVWIDFDGYPCPSRPEETATLIRRLQPGVILNNRLEPLHPDESHGLVGRWGDYATPEQMIGSYCDSVPWETCMTIANQWSWKPNDPMKSLQRCLETLVSTVGGDGNLLFNVGPMPNGEIEPAQVQRLAEMGNWLKKYGEAIYGTRGGPYAPTKAYASTRKPDAIYIHAFSFINEALRLPPLPRKVRTASLLDGTPVEFTQSADALAFTVPAAKCDANITVIKLRVEGSVSDLGVIHAPSTTGSLAYRRPAKVSSSIAPQFMHTPESALDDNDSSYWSPGRDEAIAATIPGRKFDDFRLMPEHPLWLKSGWLEVQLASPSQVGRAILKEKIVPGNYLPVSFWKIEYEEAGRWLVGAEGATIGSRADVVFPKPVMAQKFRLSIEAPGRPAIAEFQLK
jgi:alpha-L-fucosidase